MLPELNKNINLLLWRNYKCSKSLVSIGGSKHMETLCRGVTQKSGHLCRLSPTRRRQKRSKFWYGNKLFQQSTSAMSGTVSPMFAIGQLPIRDHFSHMETSFKISRRPVRNHFNILVQSSVEQKKKVVQSQSAWSFPRDSGMTLVQSEHPAIPWNC